MSASSFQFTPMHNFLNERKTHEFFQLSYKWKVSFLISAQSNNYKLLLDIVLKVESVGVAGSHISIEWSTE